MTKARKVASCKGNETIMYKSPVIKFPCGSSKCGLGVLDGGICCDGCNAWYHFKCSKLSEKACAIYLENIGMKWVCQGCMRALLLQKVTTTVNRIGKRKEAAITPIKLDTSNESACATLIEQEPSIQQTESIAGKTSKVSMVKNPDVDSEEPTLVGKGKPVGRKKKSKIQENKKVHTDKLGGLMKTIDDLQIKFEQQEMVLKGMKDNIIVMGNAVSRLEKNCDVATGRNRNVVIKGIPEPFVVEGRQRARGMQYHLVNLLRSVNIPGHVAIKRIMRIGRWRGSRLSEGLQPRPMLVEFANPRHRDSLLAAAGTIKVNSRGAITVMPDISVSGTDGIKANGGTNSRTGHSALATPRVIVDKLDLKRVDKMHGGSNLRASTSYRDVVIGGHAEVTLDTPVQPMSHIRNNLPSPRFNSTPIQAAASLKGSMSVSKNGLRPRA